MLFDTIFPKLTKTIEIWQLRHKQHMKREFAIDYLFVWLVDGDHACIPPLDVFDNKIPNTNNFTFISFLQFLQTKMIRDQIFTSKQHFCSVIAKIEHEKYFFYTNWLKTKIVLCTKNLISHNVTRIRFDTKINTEHNPQKYFFP